MLFLIHYRGCCSYMYVYSSEGKPQCFWSSQETRFWCVTFMQYLILGLSIDWLKSKNIKKLRLLVSAKETICDKNHWLSGEKCGQKSASNPAHQMAHWLGEEGGIDCRFDHLKVPPPLSRIETSQQENFGKFFDIRFDHTTAPSPHKHKIQDWNFSWKALILRRLRFHRRVPVSFILV